MAGKASGPLDLILRQAHTVGVQVERAASGLTEEQADFRLGEGLMSVRQTLIHLADNCLALNAELDRRPYEFGAWQPSDVGFPALVQEWKDLRKSVLEKVADCFREIDLEAPMKVSFATWPGWKVLSEWIVMHDAYHLGQICALRLAQDPQWDMYSIYDPSDSSE